MGSHDHWLCPLFEKKFWGFMSGPPIGACVPNLKFVSLSFLELLALNAQKLKGSRDHDHAPFSKNFSRDMSGLSLGTSMPNLKSVSLAILEPLALNAEKFTASRDPGHAPFSKLFLGSCWDFPWEHMCQI